MNVHSIMRPFIRCMKSLIIIRSAFSMTIFVILACPESFSSVSFVDRRQQEGFPTSGNDRKRADPI
jgi:hypothetical protein